VKRSHINMSVFDSRWEASEPCELDRSPRATRMAGLESEQQMYRGGSLQTTHEILATHYT